MTARSLGPASAGSSDVSYKVMEYERYLDKNLPWGTKRTEDTSGGIGHFAGEVGAARRVRGAEIDPQA